MEAPRLPRFPSALAGEAALPYLNNFPKKSGWGYHNHFVVTIDFALPTRISITTITRINISTSIRILGTNISIDICITTAMNKNLSNVVMY